MRTTGSPITLGNQSRHCAATTMVSPLADRSGKTRRSSSLTTTPFAPQRKAPTRLECLAISCARVTLVRSAGNKAGHSMAQDVAALTKVSYGILTSAPTIQCRRRDLEQRQFVYSLQQSRSLYQSRKPQPACQPSTSPRSAGQSDRPGGGENVELLPGAEHQHVRWHLPELDRNRPKP